jgi:cytidylate kinase
VDRERAAFIRKYYGKEWPDRSLYDLMINTKVGDEAVVATILDAVDTVNKSRETTSASSA